MPSTAGMDLLVLGGPTHAFGLSRPRTRQDAARLGRVRAGAADAGIREYLDVSPTLTGQAAATFATRLGTLPGSAAHRAHRRPRQLGCRMLSRPECFRVAGTTGPLLDGEAVRAWQWATALAALLLTQRQSG